MMGRDLINYYSTAVSIVYANICSRLITLRVGRDQRYFLPRSRRTSFASFILFMSQMFIFFFLISGGTESERTDTEELVSRAASQCSAPPDLLPSEARAMLQPTPPTPPSPSATRNEKPRLRFEVWEILDTRCFLSYRIAITFLQITIASVRILKCSIRWPLQNRAGKQA